MNKEDNVPEFLPVEEEQVPTEALEKIEDFAEADQMMIELQKKLDEEMVLDESPENLTLFERLKPYLVPALITILALLLTSLLLYFFSKSKTYESQDAITNTGKVEEVVVPSGVVVEEVVEPEEEIIATTTPEVATPTKVTFANGTTTIVNVDFSYDKFNYDNYPRGIFLTDKQIFEGNYKNYKLLARNRAFANDFFFGIDRYMVSLIGDCSYTVTGSDILVENMKDSTDDQSYSAIGMNISGVM
jgi:hypothetical protein